LLTVIKAHGELSASLMTEKISLANEVQSLKGRIETQSTEISSLTSENNALKEVSG
jgi:hypothetical protein